MSITNTQVCIYLNTFHELESCFLFAIERHGICKEHPWVIDGRRTQHFRGVFFQLGLTVCWHFIQATFDNQFRSLKNNGPCIIHNWPNQYCPLFMLIFVNSPNMFVGIVYHPSAIISNVGTLDLWPLNHPNQLCPLCQKIFIDLNIPCLFSVFKRFYWIFINFSDKMLVGTMHRQRSFTSLILVDIREFMVLKMSQSFKISLIRSLS